MVVLYHQAKKIEMGFCMRKEVRSIKKCRLRSRKRHFHLDGSINHEKFRVYRYWNILTGKYSKDIYKKAPVRLMEEKYDEYHLVDIEDVIDILRK